MDSEYISETMEETLLQTTLTPPYQRANDELLQELHEAKASLSRAELMKLDLELENERLRKAVTRLEQEIQESETQFANRLSERIRIYETYLEEERENHHKDMAEMEEKIRELKCSGDTVVVQENSEELLMKISSLSAEIVDLKEKLFETQDLLEKKDSQVKHFEGKLKRLEEDLENAKEILAEKSASLKSSMEMLRDAQEEKALISTELATLKAGPIGEVNRGNSLFAEVEDKRQSSEAKLRILRNKYSELKRIYTLKMNEYEKLKSENLRLRVSSQEDEKLSQIQLNEFQERYRRRIEDLMKQIKELEKRPESPQIVTITETDLSKLNWINIVVENARAETRAQRNEFLEKSSLWMNTSEQLFLAQSEIRKLKSDLTKISAQKEELQMKLDKQGSISDSTIESSQTYIEEKTDKRSGAPSQPVKAIRFADEVKENDGGNPMKENKRCSKVAPFRKLEIFK